MMDGFLVAEKERKDVIESWNPRYRGMDREPYYYDPPWPPELQAEQEVASEYIFGNYRDVDRQGLIPTLELARKILELFLNLEKKYEIIYCQLCEIVCEPVTEFPGRFLGFDVGGPTYSIVLDFPLGHKPMKNFFEKLNDDGLFNTYEEAKQYLETYVSEKLADYDVLSLAIWKIFLVEEV